jgi:hypothetical protein
VEKIWRCFGRWWWKSWDFWTYALMYKKVRFSFVFWVLDRRVSFCIYSEQNLRGKEKKREREDRFSLAMMMRNTVPVFWN